MENIKIKFWDNKKEKWLFPTFCYFNNKDRKNNAVIMDSIEDNDVAWFLEENSVDVYLFTGKRDKKGEEIYDKCE